MKELIINKKPPVYGGNEDFIFISYSHKDSSLVYPDLWAMTQSGLNIWYDDDIGAGKRWNNIVEDKVKSPACKLVIIYLSENYINSKAIMREINMINAYNKKYFAVNLGNNKLSFLLGNALSSGALSITDIDIFSKFLNEDILYIGTTGNIEDRSHVDELLRQIAKNGFAINKKIVNYMDVTKKVLVICKNSSFSRFIISGIFDYMAKKTNISLDKILIDKSLNKMDAGLQLYDELLKHADMYDGFVIRPIERYDMKLEMLIRNLSEKGKKIILLDINMSPDQIKSFKVPPVYIGSDFKAGGKAMGEKITDIANKIGIDNTNVVILSGPSGNNSAKIRCSETEKIIKQKFPIANITIYPLSSFSEKAARSDIKNLAEAWNSNGSMVGKNVIFYCGNDNIACLVMQILSRKNGKNVLYNALKNSKKIVVAGYDGIRDANNEIILKNYGIDYITVDVVPFKQGVDAGKAMYNLLYGTTDSDVTFPLTQPELVESINFPAEKYDNINDISYIFEGKKIIIFDLDGTVADTETLHWKAYNKLLECYDIYLDHEKVKDYIGHSEISIYESIKSDFNIDFDNEDFMENRINMYLELVRETDLRPYDFIYDMLEKYKDICSFVLVTSQIPSVVNMLLKLWNIDKYFPPENIFCCHDKRYDKKGLYQSIKEYGDKNKKYRANNILLIEDSEYYMESAKKLGFSVIGIEHRYNINTLISCDAILNRYAAKGFFVGLCGLDIIYYGMSEMPENNSKKKITNFISSVGGPAANAAITYSILGGEAYLFTAVGNNEISRLVKQMLAEYNVKLIDISNTDRNCNISSIYVNTINGDRTIISGQSSRRLRIDNVSELEENIRKSEFVLYDGNLLGVEKFMIQYIEYYGKDLVIDAGSNKEGFKTCFAIEPVVISSESFKNEDGLDVFELNKLYGFRNCAKTRGGASVLYESKGEIHEILVPDVKAVDTLGAGDVFHGAYCFFRYVKNHSFEDALKFAVQVASYSTCQKGVVAGVLYAKRKMEQII